MSSVNKKVLNLDRVDSLSKEKGITKAFICSGIGMRRGYFTDIKRDGSMVPIDRLTIIADILGTTVEYLTDETDQKEKPTVQNDELSEADREFLKIIRELPESRREAFLQFLRDFSKEE